MIYVAGKGGTTTTGNTAKKILFHGGRKAVIEMLPERYQQSMSQFGEYLAVILRLFSSDLKINIAKYKELCTSLYVLILESFPWARITPSVHKLLAHSWELIERNDCRGLKNFDESGLEANNKILRTVRLNLARKTSQNDNLKDCVNRMWLGSDPQINLITFKPQPFCTHCSDYGHSLRYCKIKQPTFGPFNNDDSLLN